MKPKVDRPGWVPAWVDEDWDENPSAYDLEVEPLPFCVLEVTSPKSHTADKEKKMAFYLGQGIPLYVVIDAVTRRGKPRKQAAEAELALLREKLAQYEE
jgi:Uma2 family endonuclease